jgi:hypothetical protein
MIRERYEPTQMFDWILHGRCPLNRKWPASTIYQTTMTANAGSVRSWRVASPPRVRTGGRTRSASFDCHRKVDCELTIGVGR